MPTIFKQEEIEYNELQSDLKPFAWYSSPRLSEIRKSKDLFFNMRKLDPEKYSYPYHFHRNAEELFIIMEGSATLRTSKGLEIVRKGDIVFIEIGETSTHQLYNHTCEPCIYFDLRTKHEFDVAEFPDSNKIVMGQQIEIFEKGQNVEYFKGEEKINEKWDELKNVNKL
jgi:uncharacterized cupin superfamily protein